MKEKPAPCRLCGAENTGPAFRIGRHGHMLCRECGTYFRVGEADHQNPAEIYNREYFLDKRPDTLGAYFREFDPAKSRKCKFMIRQLGQLESLTGGPGRMLDVGAANGVFAWLARERGWDAEGVEISEFAARWGEKQFGVQIHVGDIGGLPPDPVYDLITMWESIEHMPFPRLTLEGCRQRLKPGGVIAILTPDTNSLVNRIARVAGLVLPRRSNPVIKRLYREDRITLMNREALSRALIELGFIVHWMESIDLPPSEPPNSGLAKVGEYIVRGAARVIQREHRMLIYATKSSSVGPKIL